MAVHRGRIDLLEALLTRDPRMLDGRSRRTRCISRRSVSRRSFADAEHDAAGGRHAAAPRVDSEEIEIARWLIAQGRGCQREATSTRTASAATRRSSGAWSLVAESATTRSRACCSTSGADPTCDVAAEAVRRRGRRVDARFHDVTPLGWGEQFHASEVCQPRGDAVDRRARRTLVSRRPRSQRRRGAWGASPTTYQKAPSLGRGAVGGWGENCPRSRR